MYTEPTRNTLLDRCARAPTGHAAVILARTAMNSRRFIEASNSLTGGSSISECFAVGASRMAQVTPDGFGSTTAGRGQLPQSPILSALPQIPAVPRIDSRSGASCQEQTWAGYGALT